jgi:hypothetical protein
MPLIIGNVAIDPTSGAATGSGAALAIFEGIYAAQSPLFPDPNSPPSDYTGTPESWKTSVNSSIIAVKQDFARTATGIAAVILYIQDNALIQAGELKDGNGHACTGFTEIE